MNKKIKAAWVAALRSGEYTKGVGQLRKDDSFCCLGVLCNLHAQAHPQVAASQQYTDEYLGKNDFLPGAVAHWAQLHCNPQVFIPETGMTPLARCDDGHTGMKLRPRSFNKIANLIEAQL